MVGKQVGRRGNAADGKIMHGVCTRYPSMRFQVRQNHGYSHLLQAGV